MKKIVVGRKAQLFVVISGSKDPLMIPVNVQYDGEQDIIVLPWTVKLNCGRNNCDHSLLKEDGSTFEFADMHNEHWRLRNEAGKKKRAK